MRRGEMIEKQSTCSICVCSCASRDDGRWHVYTQSAESATITLTINCFFFLPVFMRVCGVVNGLWCAARQRYCRIRLIFLPPASYNLHPAAPLKPLCFKIWLLCFPAHKYQFPLTLPLSFLLCCVCYVSTSACKSPSTST